VNLPKKQFFRIYSLVSISLILSSCVAGKENSQLSPEIIYSIPYSEIILLINSELSDYDRGIFERYRDLPLNCLSGPADEPFFIDENGVKVVNNDPRGRFSIFGHYSCNNFVKSIDKNIYSYSIITNVPYRRINKGLPKAKHFPISPALVPLDDEKCNVYRVQLQNGLTSETYFLSKTRLIVQGSQPENIALYNRVCSALPFYIAVGYNVNDISTIIKFFSYIPGAPNNGAFHDPFQSQIAIHNLKFRKKER